MKVLVRVGPGVTAVLLAAAIPLVVITPYYLRVLILTCIFVALAVSYDLVVGQTGAFSLAHPAFFGVGAYAVAILVKKHDWSFAPAFVVAALVAVVVAIAVGIPSFRLQERTFAIGTMGMALILQLVANNWISLTEGPMCITGVPPIRFPLPGGGEFSTVQLMPTYYGALTIAVLAYLLMMLISTSRVGRAFRAIRENEVLAESQGINALFYKMLAFCIGAAVAGVVGGYYVTWTSLVCPSEMAMTYTVTLLIILYLGGAGSLRGVTLGAVVFTILPELLRITPQLRMVIYGVLLLLAALYLPEGFEGVIRRITQRLRRRSVDQPPKESENAAA